MTRSEFVYVIYISATPEKIWKALLDAKFTRQYWGHDNVSDWKPGSKWEHQRNDKKHTVDLIGKVLESKRRRRLVLTWAEPGDAANKAKHSRVTFEIKPIGDMVRLTITHDRLKLGSSMDRGIRDGWPRVLSSLKSLLETGHPLQTWAGK